MPSAHKLVFRKQCVLNLQAQWRNIHLFFPTTWKVVRRQVIGRSCRNKTNSHYTRNMITMISRVLIRTLIGRSRSLREICSGRMRLSSVRRSACNVRTDRTPYGSILATWTRQQSPPWSLPGIFVLLGSKLAAHHGWLRCGEKVTR